MAAKVDTIPLASSPEESITNPEAEETLARSQKRVEELEDKVRQLEEEEQDKMVKMLEQLELVRMQLREKSELLEASQSDSTLREELQTKVEELEIRGQEVDDLKLMLRR